MAGLVPAIHVCHARESGHPIVLGVNSLWIAEPHPQSMDSRAPSTSYRRKPVSRVTTSAPHLIFRALFISKVDIRHDRDEKRDQRNS
jgi:hypothetical protein